MSAAVRENESPSSDQSESRNQQHCGISHYQVFVIQAIGLVY